MSNSSLSCESLASMLSVEVISDLSFSARLENFWGASIGADALARLVLAASHTCGDRVLQSLQASFLVSPPPDVPLRIDVEVQEEGPRASRRQLRLSGDELYCQATATFVPDAEGEGYQDLELDAELPAPGDLPTTLETAKTEGWADYARGPVEFRRVGPLFADVARGDSRDQLQWLKSRAPIADDPARNAAVAVFLCDFYVHWAFERRVGPKFAPDRFRRLDQSICIHNAAHWDGWWLLDASSQISHAGRALGRRELYTQAGVLVASATHTALIASS